MHVHLTLIALALCALPASAGTWTVDDDGPADFSDIQPAIDAASPGDVLKVKPGTYGIFTLDKALVLVAEAGAKVAPLGTTWIQGVHAGPLVAVAGLEFTSTLTVTDCSVPVVLDGVVGRFVSTSNAADVRVRGCTLRGISAFFGTRLEVGESISHADPGADGFLFGAPGASGLECDATSVAHAYRSSLRGGKGGDASDGAGVGGDGGNGVHCKGELLLGGSAVHVAQGGLGGWPGGGDGLGLKLLSPAAARISGVTVLGTSQEAGSSLDVPFPADPALRILAPVGPGGTVTYRLDAEPGSQAVLNLGRMPQVLSVPGPAEDALVVVLRTFDMGSVGPEGTVGFNFKLPNSAATGFTFFAQARVSLPDGSTRYSNSVPLVLR